MTDFRRLLATLRPHRTALAVAGAALAGVSAATVCLAALLRPLFDRALAPAAGRPAGALVALPLALVALYALKGLLAFAAAYLLSRTAHRVVAQVREQAFAALQRQGAEVLERHPSGALVARLTADTEVLHSTLSEHLASLCRDSLVVVGLMAWVVYVNPALALLSLCVAPAVIWPTVGIGRRLRRVARSSRERLGVLAGRVQESIAAARVVRAFGLQSRLEEGFQAENGRLTAERQEAARWLALASPLMEWLGGVAAALVFVASARALQEGTMTGGALLSFLTALFLQYAPIKRLSHVHSQVQQGLAAAARLFELIDAPGEEAAWPGRRRLQRAVGDIEFRNVRLARQGRTILDGVNLRLEPGGRVLISGASGAGKTTLLSLLLGFVRADAGEVRLDGVNVGDLALADLRRQISVVGQETVLFAGTLADNLRCARPEASNAEILSALRAAQLEDLVERFPAGIHTRLLEGGAPLSAGERQRVAIARALLKNAPVVLLDEATSALDPLTEQRLHAALERLVHGRTVLIVSHRREAMRLAPRRVRLVRGRIEEVVPSAAPPASGGEAGLAELETVPRAAAARGEGGIS